MAALKAELAAIQERPYKDASLRGRIADAAGSVRPPDATGQSQATSLKSLLGTKAATALTAGAGAELLRVLDQPTLVAG